MTEVVVIDGARTPMGSFGGSLKGLNAPTLLDHVFKGELEKTKIDPKEIDEVIVGQVFQGSDSPNIARFVGLRVGIPNTVPGVTLNRQCASGLEAAVWGAKNILCGESELVLTGGVESMSTVPYLIRGARWGYKMGPQFLVDGMAELYDDVTAAGMWIWAENMSERFEVSREEQDRWALISHQRAVAANENGRFAEEIYPIEIAEKRSVRMMDKDEDPRADTSLEKLAALPLDQLVAQIRLMVGHADNLIDRPEVKRSLHSLDLTLANAAQLTRTAEAQVGPLLQRLNAADAQAWRGLSEKLMVKEDKDVRAGGPVFPRIS